jgi:hypothetical protein
MSADHNRMKTSTIGMTITRFAVIRQPYRVCDRDSGSTGRQSRPDDGMSMGHMSQGMMGGGGMMASCAEMMQSMNNGGNGRPNSQWQKRPPQSPNNGG